MSAEEGNGPGGVEVAPTSFRVATPKKLAATIFLRSRAGEAGEHRQGKTVTNGMVVGGATGVTQMPTTAEILRPATILGILTTAPAPPAGKVEHNGRGGEEGVSQRIRPGMSKNTDAPGRTGPRIRAGGRRIAIIARAKAPHFGGTARVEA